LKEDNKERKDMDSRVRGTLWRIVQIKIQPKTKKRCKAKVLTTVKTWDDSSSEGKAKHKRHNHKHSSSHFSHKCIMMRGNTKDLYSSESDSDNNSDDKQPLMKNL
jgi:hypothetical protein